MGKIAHINNPTPILQFNPPRPKSHSHIRPSSPLQPYLTRHRKPHSTYRTVNSGRRVVRAN